MPDALVESLVKAAERFTVKLRLGDGFDESMYAELCATLRACAEAWLTADAIPRVAANVLVDMHAAIEGTFSLYHGEELKKIEEALYRLSDLVRESVALRPKDCDEYGIR